MYLQEFLASGPLDHAGAEQVSWTSAASGARIHLAVNGRRLNPLCLPLCCDELDIRAGTPVVVSVDSGGTDDDGERRALIDIVDCFQSMTTPAEAAPDSSGRRHSRWRFRHGRR